MDNHTTKEQFDATPANRDRDARVGKTYTFTATCEDLAAHNGIVLVKRKLDPNEYDEAETGLMYEVESVADHSVFQVFEDELSSPVAFDSLVEALNGSYVMDNNAHFIADDSSILLESPCYVDPVVWATAVADFVSSITHTKVNCEATGERTGEYRIYVENDKN